MADTREITRDIQQQYGSVLNISKVARYLGRGRDKTREFLQPLDFYRDGRDKMYLAIDIAKRLNEIRQRGQDV